MSHAVRATSLYTAAQVRALDRAAIERLSIPAVELMQRAAAAAYASLRRRWPQARRVVLLAGNGNNGGDAFLLGRLALRDGWTVDTIALSDRSVGTAEQARAAFVEAGGRVRLAGDDTDFGAAEVCVDGLFGVGLGRPIDGAAAALVARLDASRRPVLALDLPSGLDADRGIRLGPCVRADATISFVAWKRGAFTADAADVCGERELASLDVPAAAFDGIDADAELLDSSIARVLAPRAGNVNKSHYGHVLAIGGDEGMGGAIRLAGEAALRTGAGLVSVATRPAQVLAMNAARPELMAHGIDDEAGLRLLLERASIVAVGPGLGQAAWGRALFGAALACGKPLLLDADALNLLAETPRALPVEVVLTPHPGEAARLLGCDTATIQRDRYAAARALAQRYAAVVVLKGAGSLIADPRGRVAVCPWGNSGMASGGMGDVLSGVIAALLAQRLSAWDAARLGVALHARAGDLAAAQAPRGLLASDLFEPLRRLANRFDA
ncbi:NAD(P)H-hydrate dehydratase [Dokdonella sp.]|uniref:NAD(P)H-hydrate dehydratase n=1 Tax=Dokdonella sp. TaxID=2291710 RepID=UPI001AFF3304|nr:NAD(P)H-hydrate dehydratase [Dokdonella sp.]MBO9662385.1 NAD(P)H-hydrate dehydratase [Dokdonella sp.]